MIDPDILRRCLAAVDRAAHGIKGHPTADEIPTAEVPTREERAAYRAAILDVTRAPRESAADPREHRCRYCGAAFGDREGKTRHEGRMHREVLERDIVALWSEHGDISVVAQAMELSAPTVYKILDRAGVKRRRTRWQDHPEQETR